MQIESNGCVATPSVPLYNPPIYLPSGMCVIGAIYCSTGCRLRVGVATPTVPSPLIWLLIKIIVAVHKLIITAILRKIIRSCRDGFKVHLNPRERINHPPEWIISPHNYRPGYRREVSLRHRFPCTPVAFQVTRRSARFAFFFFFLSLTRISSYWLYKSVFCVQEWIIWLRHPVLTWDGTERARIVKPTRTPSDFI